MAKGLCSLSRPFPRSLTGARTASLTDALSVPGTPRIGTIAELADACLEMVHLVSELSKHGCHVAVRRFLGLRLVLTSSLLDERRRDHRGHDRQERDRLDQHER